MTYWVLSGSLIFSVPYGCDMSEWLFGIFNSKEEAEARMYELKHSEDILTDANGEPIYGVKDVNCDYPALYMDLDYGVDEFTGKPLNLGGVVYLD